MRSIYHHIAIAIATIGLASILLGPFDSVHLFVFAGVYYIVSFFVTDKK